MVTTLCTFPTTNPPKHAAKACRRMTVQEGMISGPKHSAKACRIYDSTRGYDLRYRVYDIAPAAADIVRELLPLPVIVRGQ